MEIKIWTDGSFNRKNNKCSWAYVIKIYDHNFYHEDCGEIFDTDEKVSTNVGEMYAVIKALEICIEAFPDKEIRKDVDIHVTSDSQYVVKGITYWIHDWLYSNFSKRKNHLLWKTLYKLVYKSNWNIVDFSWVRGHTGIEENERCDYLAGKITTTRPHLFKD